MSASGAFFDGRNLQAVLKHGLLTRYAHYFAGRAGSASRSKVLFVDGYAGQGRYDDGNPGSPLLLAAAAGQASFRKVQLLFSESDPAHADRLTAMLKAEGIPSPRVERKPFDQVAIPVLDEFDDHACLLFLDPFGLGIERSLLEQILRRRRRTQPIDVIYHFSLSALARMARTAVLGARGGVRNGELIDTALGSIDWQTPFAGISGPDDSVTATGAAEVVAGHFASAVGAKVGMTASAIPVRQRPHNAPKYLLVLFSADKQAHWDFPDLAASARIDWLSMCETEDFEANVKAEADHGIMSLFPEQAPDRGNIEARVGAEVLEVLRGHLQGTLAAGTLRPIDDPRRAYGPTYGTAKEKHLRQAVKELHAEGLLADDGKGDFHKRELA